MSLERWDKYFLAFCKTAASNSRCLSRQIGAVIVRDKSVVSTGYNGPPRGVQQCASRWKKQVSHFCLDHNDHFTFSGEPKLLQEKCPRRILGYKSGGGLELCPAAHAEVDAILFSQGDIRSSTLYCNFSEIPCRECAKLIVNAGIKRIVLNSKPTVYPEKGVFGSQILEMCNVIIDFV